ncbi:PxKF domain-containing protein [Kineococcus glutinatus]|uniref:rhamnogalacturonan lyase family protein n=1 Tax=Kineococcus glutinatus TaxID=1070872 RepID=UPI0031F066AA
MSARPAPRTGRGARQAGTTLLAVALAAGASAPVAASAASGQDLLFDFQCTGNVTAPEHTAVLPTTTWAEGGSGFLTPLAATSCRDRGGSGDPALRDFVLPGATSTFRATVPNGTYSVVLRSGDLTASSNSGFVVNGQVVPARGTGAGTIDERVVENVQVVDGRLDVGFSGSSIRINSLQVLRPVAAPQTVGAEVGATAADPSVTLSWPAVPGATGYRVYRSTAGAAPARVADVAAGATPTWTDRDVELADGYTYQVSSLGRTGVESAPSAATDVTVVAPGVPVPAAPGAPTVSRGGDGARVSWASVAGAVQYEVYRSGPDRKPVRLVRVQGTSWVDAGAEPGAAYDYRIAAVSTGGRSALSAPTRLERAVHLKRQAERLDRAPVAVAGTTGVYVGWRLLGQDPQDLPFHVYRDGRRITAQPLTGATNLQDAGGSAASTYRISTVVGGVERWATEEFGVWDQQTLDVPLQRPAGGTTPSGQAYTYNANDASLGDVDGDGQYEIVLKWDPSNSRDNSQAGYTGNVYLDALELDGTRLWRIDMGRNIRAGAHYTQFQVFDYDGNGRAEVVAKTADGTVDGAGTVIGDPAADWRNSGGYVLSGPEYLTVFDGASGAAVDTVDYVPPRGDVAAWGDAYGNRVDRFLAGTAYLDGEHPSVVMARGYYTRTVVSAWDFDGENLTSRWVFDSDEAGDEYAHQGNHNLSVADVDGDQKDEIVYGSITLDDDGGVLHNTGLGHGDALHVSDFDPSRPGLEVFAAHEAMAASGNRGATYRDAETGEILWSIPATRDTGRAAMGDIDPTHPGAEGWAVGGDAAWNSPVGQLVAADGTLIGTAIPAANFLTWWDGDLLREIGDHDWNTTTSTGVPTISKWNWQTDRAEEVYRATGTLSNNSTKGNPSLQADLFGDWREELITRTEDSSALRIATTTDLTDVRLRTLMSDPTYRLGVAWQNTGYNQPPHTSYFLGEGMTTPPAPSIALTGTDPGPAPTVVPWSVKGFYEPVDMGGVLNTVKGGSTVPLKFEVFAGEREITDTALVDVSVRGVPCDGSAGSDPVEVLAAGGTALRYDAAAGRFVQNWKTPKTRGSCYAVTATAADGTAATAYVKTL